MSRTNVLPALACTLAAGLTLTACGQSTGTGSGSGGSNGGTGSGGRLDVVVSFYPLEFATTQIGGDHVAVTSLTKPGAEPHEVELTPQDVVTASKARLAIYEKGLQPSVDDAVKDLGDRALDVAPVADLSRPATAEEDEEKDAQQTANADHDHAQHGAQDPHFWLDPKRYAAVADAIAARLGQTDPDHKADYDRNLATLKGQLSTLDKDYATSLTTCTNKNLVTSHAAFGYLADRYGLTQVAISGISPEEEPDPAKLAEVARFAKAHQVTTVYAETLVSPATAQTVAKETGAQVATLDPIEGINDQSAGRDYLEVMRSNLAALRKGQSCS